MPETKRSPVEDTSDRELILTRVFDAPRELVWDAFTDPKQVVQWWGPSTFGLCTARLLLAPEVGGGGPFCVCLRCLWPPALTRQKLSPNFP